MSRNIAAILRAVELARAQRVKRRHTKADVATAPIDEGAESYARFNEYLAEYETFDLPDCKAVTPGLVRVSRAAEPKSIHTTAPSGPIKFERPPKRRNADRNERDGELPEDPRRHHTLKTTDGHSITVNPFSKRLTVSGPGFR
jgi:hypothetical protein